MSYKRADSSMQRMIAEWDEWESLGMFSGATEVECPVCCANPGQQCSDIDGTEYCTRVHRERVMASATEDD
jgi:hypothetical protein